MSKLDVLLTAVSVAEAECAQARKTATDWFSALKPDRRLLSEEDRHKELAQFVALFGAVGMKNSAWWTVYEAYRREVDDANERRATVTNLFMAIVTVALVAIGIWQGYEAHQQTIAFRESLKVQTPAPIVTVQTIPAPIVTVQAPAICGSAHK